MWNLKTDTNELIYKTETNSQTEKKLMIVKEDSEGRVRGEIYQEFWINRYMLLYKKQINNKDLLYTTGNYIQNLITTYNGKESGKEYIYVYTNMVLQTNSTTIKKKYV